MKINILIFFLLGFIVPVSAQEVIIQVKNPAPFDRSLETIEVSWVKIQKELNPSGSDLIAVFENGTQITGQTIDTDSNGVPELFIFQSAFLKGEKKNFIIRKAVSMPEEGSVTNVKYILPRKDIAWENDRIAYRIYGGPLAGDVKNGIDVWTKRVRYHIIDKWYGGDSLKGTQRVSYHIDHGEGADMFNVGKSLGAGGCALWKDSIFQQAGLFTAQKIIAAGPIRAMFKVTYETSSISGAPIEEVKTYTLDAGMNLNRIEVSYSGIEKRGPLNIAAGLVKRKDAVCFAEKKEGWISLWGPTDGDTSNGSLGTGVVMPKKSFLKTSEDKDHCLIIAACPSKSKLVYYAGAGWTRSGDYNSAEDWNKYLSEFALSLDYPLSINVIAAKKGTKN